MSIFTFGFLNTFSNIYSVQFSFNGSNILLDFSGWLPTFVPWAAGDDDYNTNTFHLSCGTAIIGDYWNVQEMSANTRLYITNSSIIFKANADFSSRVSSPI